MLIKFKELDDIKKNRNEKLQQFEKISYFLGIVVLMAK